MSKVHVLEHPVIQHKLTIMRDKNTSSAVFRTALQEISMLLTYAVTQDLPTTLREIETPLQTMQAPVIDGKKLVLISILRAGNGILDGMLKVLPTARVGHVGMYRDHETLQAVEYYFKVPKHMEDRHVIVTDPMLATGNSAIAAIERIKQTKPLSIKFVCLLAAPEGIKALHEAHPDVEIYTPAVDECLNEVGYILPGLGDAGDRIYGTK